MNTTVNTEKTLTPLNYLKTLNKVEILKEFKRREFSRSEKLEIIILLNKRILKKHDRTNKNRFKKRIDFWMQQVQKDELYIQQCINLLKFAA